MEFADEISALERVRRRKLAERRRHAAEMLDRNVIPGLPVDADARESRTRVPALAGLVDGIVKDLTRERNPFFDSLPDRWDELFAGMPIRPGRFEDGKYYIRVTSAPTLFMMRPKLPMIKKTLAALPGAPKRIELRLEIRK